MTFSWPRRWSDLSRLERVELYTRHSLYALLWLCCGGLLLDATSKTTSNAQTAAVVGGGVVVTICASWLMSAVITCWPATRPVPWPRLSLTIVASAAYLGLVGVPADTDAGGTVTTLVVATASAALAGLLDNRRVIAAVLALAGILFVLTGNDIGSIVAGLVVAATLIFTVRVSLWLLGVVTELDVARLAQTRLAVAEERLRFSRDVHDVLGRRLSTIAVQSELAATLAARGHDQAAKQMLNVRATAHEALTEARELARGYRATNLTHEVDGARSLLRSAGIDVDLDLDVVPRAWHEAAGWVVREAVTNVLRHSNATVVRISYRDGQLEVLNDGVRPDGLDEHDLGDRAPGTGLNGVRERLQPLGAVLLTHRSTQHWSVDAQFPGTGPISAITRTSFFDTMKDSVL